VNGRAAVRGAGLMKNWVRNKRAVRTRLRCCVRVLSSLVLLLFSWKVVDAQQTPQESAQPTATVEVAADPHDTLTTMFRHAEWDRWWVSGQANIVSQYHPTFHSSYQGQNSLTPEAQNATSRVLTLFTGWKATKSTEFLCAVQEAGGHGLSEALGMAGAFNLDVVRNPTLSKAPYIARLMWHQIIPLSSAKVANTPSPYSLFRELPERRLELRVGKFSIPDFFDQNTYGSDTNFQFMNWTVDNNGAYDYAADTRGFTFGVMVEYQQRNWTLRFEEALMPKVANGIHLDADMSRARAENVELQLRQQVGKYPGTLRALSYVNHANMGIYSVAVGNYKAGITPTPDITAHPLQTTVKYGFGVNIEQPLNEWMGLFARWGWNEGQHESFAYTETDQTWQFGVGGNGSPWKRRYDRVGLVFVSNGISHEHQRYLANGGNGFILGDGRLTYGREDILESFYTVHVCRGIFPAAGIQYAVNPGYNKDRGPVVVPMLRLHLEF
jgi:high affinity Mn2+ porin